MYLDASIHPPIHQTIQFKQTNKTMRRKTSKWGAKLWDEEQNEEHNEEQNEEQTKKQNFASIAKFCSRLLNVYYVYLKSADKIVVICNLQIKVWSSAIGR